MMTRSAIFRVQRGQAMIEALIASALVLVPLFLAIPVIAKYMDIRSTTVQAARYAAWERTVWFGGDAAITMGQDTLISSSNQWSANAKPDDNIRLEIGKRLLSDNGTAAFSNNDTSGGNSRQFWNDRRGSGNSGSLLQPYDGSNSLTAGGNTAHTGNEISPGLTSTLLSPLMNLASVVSNFTLDTHARYTASVGLSVQQVAYNTGAGLGACTADAADPFACQGVQDFIATGTLMNFSEKNVLVANGWSANGPGSYDEYNTSAGHSKITVYNQTRGLTPATLLKPTSGFFKDFMTVMKDIFSKVFFPEISTLDLGRIEVDRVPKDRLVPPP